MFRVIFKLKMDNNYLYLCSVEVNCDQPGGSSRVRPDHRTSVGLTPASIPNVDNYLLV